MTAIWADKLWILLDDNNKNCLIGIWGIEFLKTSYITFSQISYLYLFFT